jgi:hypothetical protein
MNRGLDTGTSLVKNIENLRTKLSHQLHQSTEILGENSMDANDISFDAAEWPIPDDRSSGLLGFSGLLHDIPLLQLTNGVVRRPTGPNAGTLSIAIEHALQHGHWDLMLSEVLAYVAHFNLGPTIQLAANAGQVAIADFTRRWRAVLSS